MGTMPTRVERGLYDAAKTAGVINSRSAAQQIDHWARIGRELEASPKTTHDQVARVLVGEGSYDELGDRAQAVVRASWDERIAVRTAALNLEGRLNAAGEPWVEADDDGNVVMHDPGAG